MFATIPVALLALSLSFFASAAPVQHAQRGAPSDWAWGYLENYDTYHDRYVALDCEDQHDTSFFDTCCHPLLATQSLSSRPSYCTPSTSVTSTSAPAATPTDTDDGDCPDDDTSTTAPANPAPTPTSVYVPPPATTSAASSGGGNSGVITGGFATYFYQGGNAGACGIYHSDSDYIVAIDIAKYGNTDDVSPLCGKQVVVQNAATGAEVTCTIADVCPTCDNAESLDMSVAAFQALNPLVVGEFPINYWFV